MRPLLQNIHYQIETVNTLQESNDTFSKMYDNYFFGLIFQSRIFVGKEKKYGSFT